MDLKACDREMATLYNRLTQAQRAMANSIDGSIKAIANLKAVIHRYQSEVTQDLEKIIFLASPKGSFQIHDKGLLYWAAQYSSRTQKLLREGNKKAVFAMWLKLVQHRVLGNTPSVSWSLLKFNENALFLRAQRKKNLAKETELLSRLQAIAAEKEELTNRYNSLVLTRANRDAAGCLQASFGDSPSEAMKHPLLEGIERLLLNGSLRIRKENRKRLSMMTRNLNLLTQFVKNERQVEAPAVAAREQYNTMESFDKFSDRLMGIDPLRDAAIEKLDQLQTQRTNREAAEIDLYIPGALPPQSRRPRLRQIGRLTNLKLR